MGSNPTLDKIFLFFFKKLDCDEIVNLEKRCDVYLPINNINIFFKSLFFKKKINIIDSLLFINLLKYTNHLYFSINFNFFQKNFFEKELMMNNIFFLDFKFKTFYKFYYKYFFVENNIIDNNYTSFFSYFFDESDFLFNINFILDTSINSSIDLNDDEKKFVIFDKEKMFFFQNKFLKKLDFFLKISIKENDFNYKDSYNFFSNDNLSFFLIKLFSKKLENNLHRHLTEAHQQSIENFTSIYDFLLTFIKLNEYYDFFKTIQKSLFFELNWSYFYFFFKNHKKLFYNFIENSFFLKKQTNINTQQVASQYFSFLINFEEFFFYFFNYIWFYHIFFPSYIEIFNIDIFSKLKLYINNFFFYDNFLIYTTEHVLPILISDEQLVFENFFIDENIENNLQINYFNNFIYLFINSLKKKYFFLNFFKKQIKKFFFFSTLKQTLKFKNNFFFIFDIINHTKKFFHYLNFFIFFFQLFFKKNIKIFESSHFYQINELFVNFHKKKKLFIENYKYTNIIFYNNNNFYQSDLLKKKENYYNSLNYNFLDLHNVNDINDEKINVNDEKIYNDEIIQKPLYNSFFAINLLFSKKLTFFNFYTLISKYLNIKFFEILFWICSIDKKFISIEYFFIFFEKHFNFDYWNYFTYDMDIILYEDEINLIDDFLCFFDYDYFIDKNLESNIDKSILEKYYDLYVEFDRKFNKRFNKRFNKNPDSDPDSDSDSDSNSDSDPETNLSSGKGIDYFTDINDANDYNFYFYDAYHSIFLHHENQIKLFEKLFDTVTIEDPEDIIIFEGLEDNLYINNIIKNNFRENTNYTFFVKELIKIFSKEKKIPEIGDIDYKQIVKELVSSGSNHRIEVTMWILICCKVFKYYKKWWIEVTVTESSQSDITSDISDFYTDNPDKKNNPTIYTATSSLSESMKESELEDNYSSDDIFLENKINDGTEKYSGFEPHVLGDDFYYYLDFFNQQDELMDYNFDYYSDVKSLSYVNVFNLIDIELLNYYFNGFNFNCRKMNEFFFEKLFLEEYNFFFQDIFCKNDFYLNNVLFDIQNQYVYKKNIIKYTILNFIIFFKKKHINNNISYEYKKTFFFIRFFFFFIQNKVTKSLILQNIILKLFFNKKFNTLNKNIFYMYLIPNNFFYFFSIKFFDFFENHLLLSNFTPPFFFMSKNKFFNFFLQKKKKKLNINILQKKKTKMFNSLINIFFNRLDFFFKKKKSFLFLNIKTYFNNKNLLNYIYLRELIQSTAFSDQNLSYFDLYLDDLIIVFLFLALTKDIYLFSSFFKKFFLKINFFNMVKFLKFFKIFCKIFFFHVNPTLDSRLQGFYFDIRGKVGVAGNSKKRHFLIKEGETSLTKKSLSMKTEFIKIITFTGVLGITLKIFF